MCSRRCLTYGHRCYKELATSWVWLGQGFNMDSISIVHAVLLMYREFHFHLTLWVLHNSCVFAQNCWRLLNPSLIAYTHIHKQCSATGSRNHANISSGQSLGSFRRSDTDYVIVEDFQILLICFETGATSCTVIALIQRISRCRAVITNIHHLVGVSVCLLSRVKQKIFGRVALHHVCMRSLLANIGNSRIGFGLNSCDGTWHTDNIPTS